MAELEARLSEENGRDVTAADLAAIRGEYEELATVLRQFVGP
jgi:hypothetical protein